MVLEILLGSALVLATTLVHGLCTIALLVAFRGGRLDGWALRGRGSKLLLTMAAVLLLFFAALVEADLWAVVYLAVGAIPNFETALYFSTVTLTTLGYGDVVLHGDWRLLASFQAVTGIIVFGWTTALLVELIQRLARLRSGSIHHP